jgi:hypothetical protein
VQIVNALIERLEAAIHSFGRVTAYPEITPKIEFCPDWRRSDLNPRFDVQPVWMSALA